MIKMIRVDNRLLHGQVAVSWTHDLGADAILIANDAVPADPVRKSVMKMAKPEGTKLVIKTIEDAAKALNSGVTDKYKLFIVVESVPDFVRLRKLAPQLDFVDLGGAPTREGTTHYDKAVNLTDDEVAQVKQLVADGVDVFVQMVPTDSRVAITKLIN
ncbi:PTS sugar transporter subunit IIB [Lacticaseibacillus pabuli]|uniref:PTS sugar transporter subunit IIB n=1 Tax=Lacticaseibacillus pabuli TaxID=3025672 RepID=A0ABY7WTA3_9LACO|nr:PTS sugar transporter subunit IIB [Lacticaseibacillus sp. KACC 23028]WDF82385.1 PTS sugar transporter subunit IIB [Lacticaseibacillus sp. KACC 23028]